MGETVPDLHVLPTPEDAADATAECIVLLAERCARARGRFTVALSGGSTPRRLYERLAEQPYADRISWSDWHVFWGDERCVPSGDADSNYRMARDAMLDRVPISPANVHRMRGETAPQEAAEEYEAAVREVFQAAMPSFDLILLGLGEDGHTASLFPGTQALDEKLRLVVGNEVPGVGGHRITFTFPLINEAKVVAFLVTDESKSRIVQRVLEPRLRGAGASGRFGPARRGLRPLVPHTGGGEVA